MCNILAINGRVFISFPTSASTEFPKRIGTLNYYDDKTHVDEPPNLEIVIDELEKNGVTVEMVIERSRPLILRCIGAVLEPFSKYFGRTFPGTWEYYGFETILHGVKNEKK